MVLAVVFLLLGLPAALALTGAVSYHAGNRTNGSIVSSGEEREYLLHVPESYDAAELAALVVSMHGAGSWPAAQRVASGWNELADEHGFIVVYPSGVSGNGPRIWELVPGAALGRDVRFIAELIDTLSASYAIDPTRVYADGLSAGGGMAFALSCTLADRIAAVGLVASAQLLPWDWCPDTRPVPVLAFHGAADAVAPYRGGRSWVAARPFPDITEWMARWARRNGCTPEPVEGDVAEDVTRRAYPGCAESADVVLYTVHGGGHTWPGGSSMGWLMGRTSDGVDATRALWAFYREHRLRSVAGTQRSTSR